jgi:sorbitol-specific phosphotransferase system component IIA
MEEIGSFVIAFVFAGQKMPEKPGLIHIEATFSDSSPFVTF